MAAKSAIECKQAIYPETIQGSWVIDWLERDSDSKGNRFRLKFQKSFKFGSFCGHFDFLRNMSTV